MLRRMLSLVLRVSAYGRGAAMCGPDLALCSLLPLRSLSLSLPPSLPLPPSPSLTHSLPPSPSLPPSLLLSPSLSPSLALSLALQARVMGKETSSSSDSSRAGTLSSYACVPYPPTRALRRVRYWHGLLLLLLALRCTVSGTGTQAATYTDSPILTLHVPSIALRGIQD
eukprot:3222270-Rhodomonas_salina.1